MMFMNHKEDTLDKEEEFVVEVKVKFETFDEEASEIEEINLIEPDDSYSVSTSNWEARGTPGSSGRTAFYQPSSGYHASYRFDVPASAARFLELHSRHRSWMFDASFSPPDASGTMWS